VSPGADGLLIIPNLAGRGSPHPDSGRGAVMHGIRVNHDAGHFVRAFLEGVAYQLRENVDVFSRNGIGANEIYAMGGGAKSGLWNSIKAAVCGMTVVTSEVDEPGCAGAAILAGVGAGLLSGIQDGCERLNKAGKRFEPDQGLVTLYDELYNNYLELSDAVYV
jgi:xylulokinase